VGIHGGLDCLIGRVSSQLRHAKWCPSNSPTAAPLLEKVRHRLRVRHYSYRTEEQYLP